MQQDDIQKRMLIFFVVVSFLLISFGLFSSFFFKDQKKEQRVEKNTQQTAQDQPKNSVQPLTYSILDSQRENIPDQTIRINTEDGYVEFTPYGGRLVSIFKKQFNQSMIPDYSKRSKLFLGEIVTDDQNLYKAINMSKYEASQQGNNITFSLKGDGFEIIKTFRVNSDGTIDIDFKSKGLENYSLWYLSAITLKSEGSFGHTGPIVKTKDSLIKYSSEDIKADTVIKDSIVWAGEENKYFLQILSIKDGINTVKIIPISKGITGVLVNVPANFEGVIFGGPKLYSLLGQIGQKYQKLWNTDLNLRSSIDFGFFGIFGKPLFLLLHFFYQYVPNWGVAIIILTILIRILFFPLNHKSLKAMKKMADLAPEIEKLKKKYSKEPQKLQEEMMKLYAQAGANPLSGCLPIVIQIPVFIALYNVLMVTVELKGAPFILWIKDLSDKDPYYILPILMGLSMIAQQFITPSSDKNQKMIMYIMAFVFTFMFLNFPSGLVLYWLTNNILGIGQSFIINKTMKR